MARYRKVDVRLWIDERVRHLTPLAPSGLGLWFYLLTNPSTTNIPGLYRAGEGALAEDLKWSLAAFREAFAEVFREGLAEACWESHVVWLPKAVKYDPPQSPNVVKGWRASWDEIPDCDLKAKAYHHLKAFTEGLGNSYREAFLKACTEPFREPLAHHSPIPDPDPEPDPEEEDSGKGSAPSPPPSEPPLTLIPDAPVERPVLTFPVVRGLKSDGATWNLMPTDLGHLREGFPDLDVLAECKKARLWAIANPTNRKTAAGMLSFLNRWLTKSQNGRSPSAKNGGAHEVDYPDFDRIDR